MTDHFRPANSPTIAETIADAIREVNALGVGGRNVSGLIVLQRLREAGYRLHNYGRRSARLRAGAPRSLIGALTKIGEEENE